MMATNGALCAGALVAFVLADGVAAHPRPTRSIDAVRLVGATDVAADPDAYAAGKRLLASDDVAAALAAFQHALSAAPASIDAMNGIGVSYDRLGRGDLARKFYRAALAIDPGAAAVLNNLGYSLFLSGDLTAAVEPLRAAAASDDAAAAAAAADTLAHLPDAIRATATRPAPTVTATARIDVTSDAEQRLTFAPAAASSDVTAALDDEAGAVVVAAAWSAADDAAMAVRVAAEQASEAAATAALSKKVDDAVAAAPDAVAAPAPVAPPASPGTRSQRASGRAKVATVSAGRLVLASTIDEATVPRRRQPAAAHHRAGVSGRDPRAPAQLAFDSDDAELNVFAARVAAARTAGLGLPDPSRRIAARFRG